MAHSSSIAISLASSATPVSVSLSAPQSSGHSFPSSLSLPTFTASETWHPERIGALAIYCSDGRWGDVFDEFCHRSLMIPHYDRFAVPGGPAWLAQCQGAAKELQDVAHRQLEFLVRVHELDRIVLITHYACAFYGQSHPEIGLQSAPGPEETLPDQFRDVRAAADVLRQWFNNMRVEGYLGMRRGRELSFHRIDV
jgi:hypothetical protein